MTIFDYVVLVILVVSVLLGVIRGIARELLSLAGWVAALVVANFFAADFAPMLPVGIAGESLRMLVAYAALFLVTMLVMSLVIMLVSAMIKSVGLVLADRLAGSLFGLVRGLVVVLLIVLLAGLTALPKQPFWRQALLSEPLETGVMMLKPWLPEDLSMRIHYAR